MELGEVPRRGKWVLFAGGFQGVEDHLGLDELADTIQVQSDPRRAAKMDLHPAGVEAVLGQPVAGAGSDRPA